ncbi:MAG TPA: DUF6350 family protein [Segeticoccus sp.]|nr:DUF6350 family protein [Segeticoccus sp.]
MSLLERTRRTPAVTSATETDWSPYLRAGGRGVLAALVPLAFLAVPVVVAWAADARADADWPSVLGMAASVWALAHGAGIRADGVSVRFLPLLFVLLPLWSAAWQARTVWRESAVVVDGEADGARAGAAAALGSYVGGYVGGAVLVVALGLLGPAPPSWWSTPLAALVVAVVGALAGGRHHLPALLPSVVVDLTGERLDLPGWVRRSVRPALWGTAALGAAGSLVAVLAVLVHLDRVAHLQQALEPGVVGGTVLVLLQLAALPNAAVWALSWCTGAGVAVGDLTISWTSVHDGVLPLVPVLGALPEPGPLPGWLRLSVLLPAAAGAVLARQVVRGTTRLAAWQDHARTATLACLLAATAFAVLGWLSGGALGTAHLAHVGTTALLLWPFLLGELLVGALVLLVVHHWRLRR